MCITLIRSDRTILLFWYSDLDVGQSQQLFVLPIIRANLLPRACPGRYFADASVWLTIANGEL